MEASKSLNPNDMGAVAKGAASAQQAECHGWAQVAAGRVGQKSGQLTGKPGLPDEPRAAFRSMAAWRGSRSPMSNESGQQRRIDGWLSAKKAYLTVSQWSCITLRLCSETCGATLVLALSLAPPSLACCSRDP